MLPPFFLLLFKYDTLRHQWSQRFFSCPTPYYSYTLSPPLMSPSLSPSQFPLQSHSPSFSPSVLLLPYYHFSPTLSSSPLPLHSRPLSAL
ncbi:hypothetical protein FKM82_027010 [Ascaphus truei]